jgi:DNA-binding transcriptional LysR family regulator
MITSMDRLQAMEAFVTVAELRGFSAAARRLRLSASAVTRLVAGLEEQLEVQLLQRTTRSVALTDAGARYLERARRILADVDEAEGAARAEQREPTGRFVVAAPVVFGRLQVAPILGAFLSRHRKVTGELLLSDAVASLVDDGIDLAVRIGQLPDSSLVARKVGETRRVVVGAPRYLRRRGRPRAPSELARHDLVHFTGLSPTPDWRFFDDGRPEPLAFRPSFVTNSADAAIGHATLGGGLTMALHYQVVEAVRAGALEVVLAGYEPPPLPIQLVHLAGRRSPATVRTFVELVATRCDWRFV